MWLPKRRTIPNAELANFLRNKEETCSNLHSGPPSYPCKDKSFQSYCRLQYHKKDCDRHIFNTNWRKFPQLDIHIPTEIQSCKTNCKNLRQLILYQEEQILRVYFARLAGKRYERIIYLRG